MALLSSLTKAILLQAETEVTAEKRSAGPLAQVTFNLLDTLEHFADVFFAKLVQRVGGWPIPVVVPSADHDGKPWGDETQRTKAMGYRKGGDGSEVESVAEYSTRVAGIMRVYFHILKVPPRQQPLKPFFQLPRYWIWFARMMGEPGLLQTAVAPQIIYSAFSVYTVDLLLFKNADSSFVAALDVCGSDAKDIWGQQWIKMLALLYEGVTVGLGGDMVIGGQSPEGKAARVRVQLEVERMMSGVR
jgi:nucleoporin GLE1